MKRYIYSVFFSIAIFFNSLLFTFLMAMGLVFVGKTSKKKKFLHVVASMWARNCVRLIFSPPKIKGLDNLTPGDNYIVIANHSSNFDIFMLLGYLNLNSVFISKETNFKIPVVGLAMKMMGCISIKRTQPKAAHRSIMKAVDSYNEGNSIIIFPEATRSPDGFPKPFKQGFLHIAKNQPVRVLPVTLSGTYHIQPKKSWQILPSQILMNVHKPRLITEEEVKDKDSRKILLTELEKTIGSQFIFNVPTS